MWYWQGTRYCLLTDCLYVSLFPCLSVSLSLFLCRSRTRTLTHTPTLSSFRCRYKCILDPLSFHDIVDGTFETSGRISLPGFLSFLSTKPLLINFCRESWQQLLVSALHILHRRVDVTFREIPGLVIVLFPFHFCGFLAVPGCGDAMCFMNNRDEEGEGFVMSM